MDLLRHLDMLYLACIYAAFAIHSLYFSTPVYESSTMALSKCESCVLSQLLLDIIESLCCLFLL